MTDAIIELRGRSGLHLGAYRAQQQARSGADTVTDAIECSGDDECDDGNTSDADGCYSSCVIEGYRADEEQGRLRLAVRDQVLQ